MDPFRTTTLSFDGAETAISAPLKIGALLTDLPAAASTLWDRVNVIDIYMPDGAGFSASEADVLNGANRFAVETPAGWEIIGAAQITLIAEHIYRLKTLLRGLNNSDDMVASTVPVGARVAVLDSGFATLDVDHRLYRERHTYRCVRCRPERRGGRAQI